MTDRIDELLSSNGLDDSTVDELVDLLSPRANGAGFDTAEILELAAHPVIADAVEHSDLPPRLEQAMAEAIGATSAMLGEWSGAPLDVQAERLKRKYEREKTKFEMVRDKLDTVDKRTAADIVGSYLDTSPAPMFSEQLAAEFSGAFERAESKRTTGRALLTADDRLLELLRFDWTDEDAGAELAELVEELADELDDPAAVATRAVATGDDDERLVAGVLAVRLELTELSHGLLMEVSAATKYAAQSAAFAARLAPSLAKHVLGRFLVDALNDAAPAEDLEVDEEALRRAIVAARTILPLIGSPLEQMEQAGAEHQKTAERVERAWEFCENLEIQN